MADNTTTAFLLQVREGIRNCLSTMHGLGHNAEDVEQEAMLKAFRYMDKFRGDCAPTSWGYSIGYTSALTFFQKQSTDPIYLASRTKVVWYADEITPEYLVGSWEPFLHVEELRTHTDEPDCLVVEEEAAMLCDKALAVIPEHWLRHLLLRDLHEMSYADIAQKEGIPLGTVQSSICRARELLRPAIESLQHEGIVTKEEVEQALHLALILIDKKMEQR